MRRSWVPNLDDELRRRRARRFGSGVDPWLNDLTPVLRNLAEQWQLEFESVIQRGSMSVVMRCRRAGGHPAVLKVSPERTRILAEAASLAAWRSLHVPAVLAVDERVGALLIEAVEPGTPLDEITFLP
jgi:streptomycin 6-kinase